MMSSAMSHGKEVRKASQRDNSGVSMLVHTCSTNIQRITHSTAQMETLLKQLERQQEASKLQDTLMQLQQNTNQLAKETRKCMKDLDSLLLQVCPLQQRQHKIQREHLLKDFMAALEDLHSVQQRVTQWRVVSAAMGQVTSNPSVDQGVHDNLLVISESQESWGQTDKSEAKYLTQEDLEMLKDRQASLHQLESDMIDMNEIFKDLSVMIQDQGDTLDGIQENMQRTEQRVEQGVEQLFQATNHQQRSRKKMCILALVMSLMTSLMMVAVSTGRQTSA